MNVPAGVLHNDIVGGVGRDIRLARGISVQNQIECLREGGMGWPS